MSFLPFLVKCDRDLLRSHNEEVMRCHRSPAAPPPGLSGCFSAQVVFGSGVHSHVHVLIMCECVRVRIHVAVAWRSARSKRFVLVGIQFRKGVDLASVNQNSLMTEGSWRRRSFAVGLVLVG